MKKRSMKYILQVILIIIGLGLIPTLFFLIKDLISGDPLVIGGYIFILILASFLIGIFVLIVGIDQVWKRSVNKLEATFDEHKFNASSTFQSSNAMFYIDIEKGKIAIISKYNPFELQIINASEIKDLRTDDGAMLKGTSLVSFRFSINGTKWRIPTFTASNVSYSLKSEEVLTAIAKADMQIDLIRKAQANCA